MSAAAAAAPAAEEVRASRPPGAEMPPPPSGPRAAPAPLPPLADDAAGSGVLRRMRRTWRVLASLLPFVLSFLRDRRRWIVFGARRRLPLEAHRERARRLADTVAALGPTFIKLAQVFGSRADIVPEPYLSEIARLQDAVAPLPAEAIEAVIEQEFGRSAHALFTAFEREPVAAASLGQVHRARVGEREVAVKVLRPGVREAVALDLEISFRVLRLVNALFPNHHVRALTTVVREFEKRIREELDLRREAAHTEEFWRHFAADGRIRAPEVLEQFTRQRVLVTEYVHGTKVDRLHARFASGDLSFPRMMETLSEAYLRMMLVDGALHADPHPGNILVEPDGTLVFLDFGMVVRIERATRDHLFRLSMAAAREDVDAAVASMYALGMIDPEVSRGEIREAAVQILGIVRRARELSQRRVQEMVQEILDAFYTWPLVLPEELVYFLRASALLEGIGFRYDPAFQGLDAVRPVLDRMRSELAASMGMGEPGEVARNLLGEAERTLRALQDVVRRTEREELRVRAHPRDFLRMERTLALLVRRVLLGLLGATTGTVSALVFLSTGSRPTLLAGSAAALLLFVVALLAPRRLLGRTGR
jgi:predicted unusual protein kinase regulating ubiquinone biosynthesis (AarF/ABC1/UbiB family)